MTRTLLTDFWTSPAWYAYEQACGDAPGTRARLLASAMWRTRLLDLTASEADLWRGVRRSYHALINRLQREVNVVACEAGDIQTHVRDVHLLAAGRATRPLATWQFMAEWMRDGTGVCVMARRVDAVVGFAYASRRDDWSYYFSAAALAPNVGIFLQWRIILTLKALGVKVYELGWQGEATDDKGRHIEFTRRGFGGEDVAVQDVYGDLMV